MEVIKLYNKGSIWLLAGGLVVFCFHCFVSLLVKVRRRSTDLLFPLKVTKGQLFIVIVGTYLLFLPYTDGYEDVLLLSLFVMVMLYRNTPPLTSYQSLALVFILFLVLLHNIFPINTPSWLSWILKALILGYMFSFCRFKKERKEWTN